MVMKVGWGRAVMLLLFSFTSACGGPYHIHTPNTPTSAGLYTTTFLLTENPISESENWVNGGAVGLDWTDVSTQGGMAIGHQGSVPYSDSTALLQSESWTADQSAQGTVYSINQNDNCYQEVELRLRSHVAPHSITGYEINYKASQTPNAYMQIVRWNGPQGDFTTLLDLRGSQYGVKNGDVVKAKIVGSTIYAYKNGELQGQVTDSTYSSGSPGTGFNINEGGDGCLGTSGDYGFTSFTALDSTQNSF